MDFEITAQIDQALVPLAVALYVKCAYRLEYPFNYSRGSVLRNLGVGESTL